MKRLPRFVAGQTSILARDLNALVDEVARLRRLSVAPPLAMSNVGDPKLRLQPQPETFFLAVTVATPAGESDFEDYWYYAERVKLGDGQLDDTVATPYVQYGDWFIVTNLAERVYDGSDWFGSHMLPVGTLMEVRRITAVDGEPGYITNMTPRDDYVAEVDSVGSSTISAKILMPDGTNYGGTHPWASNVTVNVPANGPGSTLWPVLDNGDLIAVAKHGTSWQMTGVLAQLDSC